MFHYSNTTMDLIKYFNDETWKVQYVTSFLKYEWNIRAQTPLSSLANIMFKQRRRCWVILLCFPFTPIANIQLRTDYVGITIMLQNDKKTSSQRWKLWKRFWRIMTDRYLPLREFLVVESSEILWNLSVLHTWHISYLQHDTNTKTTT